MNDDIKKSFLHLLKVNMVKGQNVANLFLQLLFCKYQMGHTVGPAALLFYCWGDIPR